MNKCACDAVLELWFQHPAFSCTYAYTCCPRMIRHVEVNFFVHDLFIFIFQIDTCFIILLINVLLAILGILVCRNGMFLAKVTGTVSKFVKAEFCHDAFWSQLSQLYFCTKNESAFSLIFNYVKPCSNELKH